MIEDRGRITYRELEASKRQVIDGSAQVLVATGGGGSGGQGSFPGHWGQQQQQQWQQQQHQHDQGWASQNCGGARSGNKHGKQKKNLQRQDPYAGRGGGGNQSWPQVRDARFVGPGNTQVILVASATPRGIPLTYVGLKAPSRESTLLTPAQGVVTGAAR